MDKNKTPWGDTDFGSLAGVALVILAGGLAIAAIAAAVN